MVVGEAPGLLLAPFTTVFCVFVPDVDDVDDDEVEDEDVDVDEVDEEVVDDVVDDVVVGADTGGEIVSSSTLFKKISASK